MSRPPIARWVPAVASIAVVLTQGQVLDLMRLFQLWEPTAHLAAAVRVARDPSNGQLVAPEHGTPLTLDEMMAAARAEARGLVTLRNADGSETLNHEGRFADQLVIRVGPDGKRSVVCVQGTVAADRALRPAAAATPRAEDR